jgi:hypothetical protein
MIVGPTWRRLVGPMRALGDRVQALIHLDHVDDAGHNKAHGTPDYYTAVAEADRVIGLSPQGLTEAGIAERTIEHVTSDRRDICPA